MSSNTVTPCWVEKESVDKFVNLKMKLTAIVQATAEINRFVEEDMPDDNQLAAEHKQAGKRAEKLQTDLQVACNELTALTVVVDDCFGDEFFSSIVTFIEETRKNEEARNKVLDMKNRLSSRGIVTHQTNISTDQVKTQLPVFSGSTSISIIDAIDTWTNILKNSGIHRQIWGNIILGRIQDPALSSIPLSVKREAKFDEICKALNVVNGGAMIVSKNIMSAHLKAGSIPDPSLHPEAALKVLRGHFEIMEHAARFIELSDDENADSEIMTGGNLTQILELLPLRIRQEDDSLDTAETNISRRKDQYMKIKKWVAKMQQKLIVQGTKLDEKSETTVAMVTVDEQYNGKPQYSGRGHIQGNKSNRNHKKERRNGRSQNNADGNPVTECGLCNLIKEKDVPQDYVRMDFNERHYKVGQNAIWPNQCIPWMMLSIEERIMILENKEVYCKYCLRLLKIGTTGNSCGKGKHIRKLDPMAVAL